MDLLEIAVAALRLALVLVLYLFLLAVLRAARAGVGSVAEERQAPGRTSTPLPRGTDATTRGGLPEALYIRLPSGEREPVRHGTVVGRTTRADIQIQDETVSGTHARFERDADRWQVRDLGSTNGTAVNGVRVREAARVSAGDMVALGGVQLQIE